jgi:hypothetical protein
MPFSLLCLLYLHIEVCHLDSDDYRIRQAAYQRLDHLVNELEDRYALFVVKAFADDNNLPPEIRRNLRPILTKFYTVLPSDYPVLPWVDRLPDDWPNRKDVIEQYLKVVREYLGDWYCYSESWMDYRIATQLLIVDLRNQSFSRWQLQQLLDRMVEREIAYRREHNMVQLVRSD